MGSLGPQLQRHSPWVVAVLHRSEAHPLGTGRSGKGQHQPLKETADFAEVAAADGRGAVQQEHDVSGINASAGHLGGGEERSQPLLGAHPPPCTVVPWN